MAKITSVVTRGTQGTLQNLTFVNSKRYGDHVRSKRGTIKPAVLNDALIVGKKRLAKANEMAQLVFHAVRDEHKDGTLWSRLLSNFQMQLKEGVAPSVYSLADMECSLEYPLGWLLDNEDYSLSVQQQKRKYYYTIEQTTRMEEGQRCGQVSIGSNCCFPEFQKRFLA